MQFVNKTAGVQPVAVEVSHGSFARSFFRSKSRNNKSGITLSEALIAQR